MYRTNDSRTSKGSPGWLTVLLVVAGLLLVPPGVEAQTRTASTHATLLIGHYSNSAVSGTLGGVLYGKEGLSGRAGGGGNLGLLFGGGSGALAVELYGLWRTSSSEAVDAASPYLGAGPSIWAGIAGMQSAGTFERVSAPAAVEGRSDSSTSTPSSRARTACIIPL